jgi:two-component system chemotaxis sensor kinase CheA
MSQNSSLLDTFFEECTDLLEALDEGLGQITDGERDPEVINAVFRAVHSIKGGAGAFGLSDLVGFAHTFETVFDEVRSLKLELDDKLIPVLVRAADHLVELVEAARSGEDADDETRTAILAELESYLEDTGDEDVEFEPMGLAISLDLPGAEEASSCLEINFRPHPGLYKNGHEPLFLLRSLSELGDATIELDTSDLPALDEMDPSVPYLLWKIKLDTEKSYSAVYDVFDFVEGLCHLTIVEPNSAPTAPDLPTIEPSVPTSAGPAAAPAPAQDAKQASSEDNEDGKSEDGKSKAPKPSLRVDPDRVDRLINTVGELIINQSMLAQRISQLDPDMRRDCQCRSKIPQKCRSNFPHFRDLVTSQIRGLS